MSLVRKHRAPKGALRLEDVLELAHAEPVCQKAPSARRYIKTCTMPLMMPVSMPGQKASSAKRCIKTSRHGAGNREDTCVRKHRAPRGALRHPAAILRHVVSQPVRKHRAPKGALRPLGHCIAEIPGVGASESTERQKVHQDQESADSTQETQRSQKAPSARRCIKTWCIDPWGCLSRRSESTERQKVH